MIAELMKQDHRESDRLLALLEDALAGGRWEAARERQSAFAAALEAHFKAEETLLFVRLEAVMGPGFGPTAVMCEEHDRLRAVLADLERSLASRDDNAWFAQADGLRVLLQQHNLKEEAMLYPFAEQLLAGECGDIAFALSEAMAGACKHG